MALTEEIYKQLIAVKLKEKLKGTILDSLNKLTVEALEGEKQALLTETAQKLNEIEKYYEIMDSFMFSDDENLEAAGAYLLGTLFPNIQNNR